MEASIKFVCLFVHNGSESWSRVIAASPAESLRPGRQPERGKAIVNKEALALHHTVTHTSSDRVAPLKSWSLARPGLPGGRPAPWPPASSCFRRPTTRPAGGLGPELTSPSRRPSNTQI